MSHKPTVSIEEALAFVNDQVRSDDEPRPSVVWRNAEGELMHSTGSWPMSATEAREFSHRVGGVVVVERTVYDLAPQEYA